MRFALYIFQFCLLLTCLRTVRSFRLDPSSGGSNINSLPTFYPNKKVVHVPPLTMISHQHGFAKLGKPADQRRALLRGLTTEVLRHGRIHTTFARAKAARKPVDHIVTLAKKGTLHHRRQALAYVYDKDLVRSVFEQVPARYGERQGGYCRVLRDPLPRRGDNAKMAFLEMV